MRIAFRCSLTVAALALILTSAAWADVPTHMNVQGRLADSTGAPQGPGAFRFTFRLFDAELGGSQVWPGNGVNGEERIIVLGADGLWTAALGTDSALTETVFLDTTRWLEVTVDNFIDPAEALPRTKLNTSPYTFRAATVQTVDGATGGTLLGSLDVAGGMLLDSSTQLSGTGTITGVNSDGNGVFDFSNGYVGVMGQASTNSGSYKMGLAGYVSSNTGAGAAYGVYADVIAGGPGPRYSGYFTGGDLIVTSPATPGNSSVQLPSDAISDFEIEDEPGLSNSLSGGMSITALGIYTLDSIEIDCPTNGYVIVTGRIGWVNVTHVTGTSTELWFNVGKTAGAITPADDGIAVWRLQSTHPSTGVRAVPLSSTRVFAESAGVQKYYLVYRYQQGSGANAGTNRASIRAVFIPTLYGTSTLAESVVGGYQPGADVPTDGSSPLPPLRTRTITVADHKAAIDAELAELRARLEALESVTTPVTTASTSEER